MVSHTRNDKTIGILVADDHSVVREGLRAVLNAEPDMRVLGEATNGNEAERLAILLHPDVIVMDIYMPERDGLQSLTSIKKKLSDVKVLLLTVSAREDDLVNAIRCGADGYLLKKGNVSDVVEAVREMASGETALPPHVARDLLRDMLEKRGGFGLSAREHDTLELLGQGLSNRDIAGRLFLSQKTVGTYVYRLLQKLHLENRGEAIVYSIRHLNHSEPF